MNRRGFFAAIAGTVVGAVIAPQLELLLPTKTIFLPPRGGWLTSDCIFTSEKLLMSLDEFARRYIKPAMAEVASCIEADVMRVYAIDVQRPVSFMGSTYDVRVL